ncbi:hypothetical protein Aple_010940 [Acrocarpospora pleiomorpha]|uniref:Uncharacterized protein n=1 Tax=Acrocarpospora pleiomorpha TaxID=90975 RepID=A0A5M3XDC1_9ACTN|nr:hypothetical protein [Acrocarpospora pleiomorpha]GES18199.1 hypothetical protein Aple_010940 [Acrocarpospora pleiomorpha]
MRLPKLVLGRPEHAEFGIDEVLHDLGHGDCGGWSERGGVVTCAEGLDILQVIIDGRRQRQAPL